MFTYIDIIIIAIVVLSIIIGIFSGFIRSLTRFCGFFVKMIISFFLAKPIALFISKKTKLGSNVFLKCTDWAESLGENFSVNLKTIASDDLGNFVNSSLEEASIPKIFRGIVSSILNITPESIESVESITLAEIVGKSVSTLILIVCAFLLIFLVLSIVIWLFNRLERKILKTTKVLSKIDRTLGGLIGLLSAVETIFTIFLVLSIFKNASFMNGFFNTLENSFIGKPVSEFMFSLIDKNYDISATINDWIATK